MSTKYLDTLTQNIPHDLEADWEQLKSHCQNLEFLETLIRFISGGEPHTPHNDWSQKQQSFSQLISTSQKRPREDVDVESYNSTATKKIKLSSEDEDDDPLFTLHSISVTSPIRKKTDVSIHNHSIRFTNPSTKSIDCVMPLKDIIRAFLLPTRGKQKPHYTVILLTSDLPNNTRKGGATSSSNLQISFGVDATPSPPFTTTNGVDSPMQHPKGSSIVDSLHTFLSYLPAHALPIIESSTDVHTNAAGSPGVEAYRAAKPGSLWFFKKGILWDAKPIEFWSLEDLVSSRNGGVRLLSATGRTCSVILKRKLPKTDEDNSDAEDEDYGVDTDIGMIEGKEQDGISQWVKKYASLFGRKVDSKAADSKGKGKEVAKGHLDLSANPMAEAESDLEDDNYTGSEDISNSDSTRDENSSIGSEDDGDMDEEGSASAQTGDFDGSAEASEEEELKPENHPLLRPGAMPRMSRAAMDAVVGMVESDMLGTASKPMEIDGDEEEEEEDELDE